MRGMIAAICSMIACTFNCQCQNRRIGTDLLGCMCFETARISIDCGFAPRWSAGADACINMNVLKRHDDTLVSEHNEGLSVQEETEARTFLSGDCFQEIGFHIGYWPDETFKGCFISIGGKIQDRHGPDMTLGIGYSIRIWKGLAAEAAYRFGIREAYKEGRLPISGIKAGVYYVF